MTKKTIKGLWQLKIDQDKKECEITKGLEHLCEGQFIFTDYIDIWSAIKLLDYELWDLMTYIYYDCPDENCEYTFKGKTIKVKGKDLNSLYRLCKAHGILKTKS